MRLPLFPSGSRAWMGSLIYESRDASGLYYRRNRFYDAETGRFTQEDPIGMAGGINVYGFANGDPVSYGDAFGFCAEEKGAAPDTLTTAERTRLRCIAENYLKPAARDPFLRLLDGGGVTTASTTDTVAAYVPWFESRIVFSGGPYGYISNFSEIDVATAIGHELRHIIQQRTPMVQLLFATGRYEGVTQAFENDAQSYGLSMLRRPQSGDGVLGGLAGELCPTP